MPSPSPRALTLDLDDTLWPIAPAIARAERAAEAFLLRHAPRTAARYPRAALRTLREQVACERPDLAHDLAAQRLLTLRRALAESGDDPRLAEPAFDAFMAERQRVEPWEDVPRHLPRLAGRYPLGAVTNGNADLGRIGLAGHFRFCLGAREHGAAKPAASIFLAACARLGLPPTQVLHVGDDPELDIEGARRAGLATCWINRDGRTWPGHLQPPDWTVRDLEDLTQCLTHGEPVAWSTP
ncbi:MAG: hydrolase [Lysobacteraceae bacterium]|nr:MAG: hydrolase [Xanthomonadaceae bacterium]